MHSDELNIIITILNIKMSSIKKMKQKNEFRKQDKMIIITHRIKPSMLSNLDEWCNVSIVVLE